MRRLLTLLFCLFCCHVSFSQNVNKTTSDYTLPYGVMTYNPWSGNISVAGQTIPRELENRYFDAVDFESFKSGRRMSNIGGIIGIIGACPFGYGIGYMIGMGEIDWTGIGLSVGGGLVMAAGLVIHGLGNKKLKVPIAKYNSSLAFNPELNFGSTANGIGIALVF